MRLTVIIPLLLWVDSVAFLEESTKHRHRKKKTRAISDISSPDHDHWKSKTRLDNEFVFRGAFGEDYVDFLEKHPRNFSSHEEKMRRFKQFKKTMDKVLSYGRRRGIGINKFADWLPSELANMACFTVPDQMERRKPHFEIQEPLPERFSWEDYGILTRVKDQLTCDSCWAMATAGIIESLHNYRDGTLTSCSVQQLVDCSREWGTHGCNASNPGDALNYVWNISSRLQGLSDWDYYPYDKRATEPCRYIPREGDRGIKYWSYTSAGAEVMQRLILRRGPIVGAVNASDDFMNFKGTGVFKDPDCPTTPTHALMIVGWGVAEDETPYWIVKNSWGESWGNAGFAKIERNVNMCGIEVWGYWVTI